MKTPTFLFWTTEDGKIRNWAFAMGHKLLGDGMPDNGDEPLALTLQMFVECGMPCDGDLDAAIRGAWAKAKAARELEMKSEIEVND